MHLGHHASCAVVRDGELVAAVQLERLSRTKHHAVESFWHALPIGPVLRAAGVELADVGAIVSSTQAMAPGGFGLHAQLVEPGFSTFDPFDERHTVISHHLAHAYCAAAYAPEGPVAVVVSDYAGSTTPDGKDFVLPFAEWYRELTTQRHAATGLSENLSIYVGTLGNGFDLRHREFNLFHPQRRSAVWSVASLYANVTSMVMGSDDAYGSLMALAAFGDRSELPLPALIEVDNGQVRFRNDWQHRVFEGGRTRRRRSVPADTGPGGRSGGPLPARGGGGPDPLRRPRGRPRGAAPGPGRRVLPQHPGQHQDLEPGAVRWCASSQRSP
jgi:carbamoyltransferase